MSLRHTIETTRILSGKAECTTEWSLHALYLHPHCAHCAKQGSATKTCLIRTELRGPSAQSQSHGGLGSGGTARLPPGGGGVRIYWVMARHPPDLIDRKSTVSPQSVPHVHSTPVTGVEWTWGTDIPACPQLQKVACVTSADPHSTWHPLDLEGWIRCEHVT